MKKQSTVKDKAYHYGIQLVAVGSLTGLFAGVVITFFHVLVEKAELFARDIYAFFFSNPWFIPLLFVALFLGAIVVGGMVKAIPMIRGCGIPQTEGATRGLLHFRWYRVLVGMFAASLLTVFMGVSSGAEGPSITLGGACGYGTGRLLKRGEAVRRYQVTGGACTGLAVASNAPLTGMVFAFEEAHKRFTPEVFICSFSSVLVGVFIRNLLLWAMGMDVAPVFAGFQLAAPDAFTCLYVLLGAVLCGLLGVVFYKVTVWAKKRLDKFTAFKGIARMVIPFTVAGVFGLIVAASTGGGKELILSLQGGMSAVERVFGSPIWVTLLFILALKFISTVLNMGAGVPCDIFIPLLALGACVGGLVSLLCMRMGMDPAQSDLIIVICMATVFTCVVKAPLTAVIMTVELTGSFTALAPVILGVAIGYVMGDIFHTEPLYERLLEDIVKEKEQEPHVFLSVVVRVDERFHSVGRQVRDVYWPIGSMVVSIDRGDEKIIPHGKTTLLAGDILHVQGNTPDKERFFELLKSVGEIVPDQA